MRAITRAGAAAARRRASDDSGSATVEYVGVLLVVVAVIASIVVASTPIGGTIMAKICQAFGATCTAPGSLDADGDRVPDEPCTVGTDDENIDATVSIAFVDIGTSGTMTIEQMSDGTYKVTVGGQVGADAVLSAGEAKGGLEIGDYGGQVALSADLSAGLFAGAGVEYEFGSKKEADAFADYVHRTLVKEGAASLAGPAVGPGAHLLGQLFDKVTGYDYKPPSPGYSYYEGGTSVGAGAAADIVAAGGSAEASATQVLGLKLNHANNDVTVYNRITVDAEAAAKLGLSASDGNWGQGASGSAGIELVVATTLDSSGNLKDVSFDGVATAEGSVALTQLAGFPLQGGGGRGVTLSASFDVTDSNRQAVTAALAGIGVMTVTTGQPALGAQVAIPAILAEARASGNITAQTLDVSSSNLLNAALSLKAPAIGGLGLSLGASTGSQDTLDAYYLGKNGWKDWTACVA
ncbi:hypothetical protein [Cellulomonas sp. URHB0016]